MAPEKVQIGNASNIEVVELLLRVYGDSLGLPRFQDEVPYLKTYPEQLVELLKDRLPNCRPHLYNRSKPAATAPALSADFTRDSSYFGPTRPQLIIIHCGICDCAPRPLPPRLRRLVGRLPGPVRSVIIKLLHDNRHRLLGAGLSWREVSPTHFSGSLKTFIKNAADEASIVSVINIAPTTQGMELRSPGLGKSIVTYNKIIDGIVADVGRESLGLIDAYGALINSRVITDYVNQNDGHHITERGHGLYCDLLAKFVVPRLRVLL